VWELVLANGKVSPGKHHEFPICETANGFAKAVGHSRRLDGVHPDAIAAIQRLQPYADGVNVNHTFIWMLDKLTNINKHRRIILTVLKTIPLPKGVETSINDSISYAPVNPPVSEGDTKIGPFPIVDGKMQVNADFASYIPFSAVVIHYGWKGFGERRIRTRKSQYRSAPSCHSGAAVRSRGVSGTAAGVYGHG
jgi:hypothetical protein